MSRVGKMPINLPDGVTATVGDGLITVSGPKGNLSQEQLPGLTVDIGENKVVIERNNDEALARANHGLTRALVNNMVQGVSQGFEKKLELHGVGYRVQVAGTDLKLNLGFSHEVVYKIPAGINISVEQNVITVSGIDKQQVGQVAAEIRALKKPEPYKGKGIRYAGEHIIRKSGKSGKEQ